MRRCCRRAFPWRTERSIETKTLSASWWIPPSKRSMRIRPMRAHPPRDRELVYLSKCEVSSCARAICACQRAAIMWGAIPMPISSSAPGATEVPAHALGRVIRDISRRSRQSRARRSLRPAALSRARVRLLEQRQRGPNIYSLHAPEWSASQATLAPYCSLQSLCHPVTAPKRSSCYTPSIARTRIQPHPPSRHPLSLKATSPCAASTHKLSRHNYPYRSRSVSASIRLSPKPSAANPPRRRLARITISK